MSVTVLAAYALGVAGVLAASAWLLERALTSLRLPLRGVWIGALALSIGLPMTAVVSGPPQASQAGSIRSLEAAGPIALTRIGEGGTSGDREPGVGAAALGVVAEWRAWVSRALASGAALPPAGDRVEAWIAGGWGAASILVAMVLLLSMRRLGRRAKAWPEETLLGRSVKVSPEMGPATMGVFAPQIVLPGWARKLPPPELELVLRHEEEHVRSRDTLLLALGLVAVVTFPWNPLVWWQVRRLKEAVEVDCDRRVLGIGVSPARYGDLLVRLGSRGRIGPLAVPTIAGSTSLLERRLTVMKNMRGRISVPRVLATTVAALLLIGVACTTDPPVATEARVAGEPPAASEARSDSLLAIWIDRDGTVQVNDAVHPLDRVSEVVAPLYSRNAVVSIEAHRAAPYGLVSKLAEQLRAAGLQRVVFTTVESPDQRSRPRDVETLVEDGLAVVLPPFPGPESEVEINPRNLLFLEVLPTGIVAARRGDRPAGREIAPRDVEALWGQEVAENGNLIAVVRTHPDAEYRHMYDVLDALIRAKALRFSLHVAE